MGDVRFTRGYLDRASSEDGKPLTFVLATEGRKADGLDLQMSGVELGRFESNPVLLWAHNYGAPPIGMWSEARVDGARLLADATFDQGDTFATDVERKYRAGFMNAVSVGFDPIKIEDEDGKSVSWWQGGKVTEWELMEASAVPVPMDPEALVDSGRAALRSLGRQLLEVMDARELWTPRGGSGNATDEEDWDGPAVMSAGSSADDPVAFFRGVAIERTVGEADERQHWALPHHRRPGLAANAAGIRNARARFDQAEDLVDREAARTHLFETHKLPSEVEDSADVLVARTGAVLSARNRERLEQARDLILEVLESASKSTETEQQADTALATRLLEALG